MATTTGPRPRGRQPSSTLSVVPLTLAVVATLAAVAPARAQSPAAQREPTPYRVIMLPSLGGGISEGRSLDARGIVSGYSDLADGARHAAVWLDAEVHDLGTLGGPNSAVVFPGNSNRGQIVGIAETADLDPLQEAWSCSAFFPGGLDDPTGHVCRGFAAQVGVMTDLNDLTPDGAAHLRTARAIDDRGMITGQAVDPRTGEQRAYLAVPEPGRREGGGE